MLEPGTDVNQPEQPNFNGLINAMAHLMRTIDAYAYDYAAQGRDAPARKAISNELDKMLTTWVPRPPLSAERIAKLINVRVSSKILAGEPIEPGDWFAFARAVEALAHGD